jgi:hypothetical protein
MQNAFARTTFVITAYLLMGASMASAQSTRTWVSQEIEGDDANPCSRSSPCRTFAGAIFKTNAGGEISVLTPGGYGAVTINKALTISGVGENASILGASVNGIVITAPAGEVVTLKNLVINGVNTGVVGIKVNSSANVIVDNVHVLGFNIGLEGNQGLTVVNNSRFTNNRSFGVISKGGPISVENSLITTNGVGVQADGSGIVRLTNTGIYNNATSMGCGGGTLATAGNNRLAGNVGGIVPVCTPTVAITVQ